jgi:hypothetical protein
MELTCKKRKTNWDIIRGKAEHFKAWRKIHWRGQQPKQAKNVSDDLSDAKHEYEELWSRDIIGKEEATWIHDNKQSEDWA